MSGRMLRCLAAVLALTAISSQSFAQQFPARQIHLLTPYPPGAGDAMIRILQDSLSTSLGQRIIIENRPGAAGIIASREVARASPDGYTLLFTNVGPMTVAPVVQADAGYDPVKSYAPVSLVSRQPLVLVVHPSVPANSLAELIKLAKDKPGTINYSSAGIGSFGHLLTELFAQAAGIEMTHIPYKGAAPAITAIISGEVSLALTIPTGTMNEYIKLGKLKLLGVSTLQPSPLAPGATPIASLLPSFGAAEYWFGIVAPANVSPEVITKLNSAIIAALGEPGLKEKFFDLGAVPDPSTPDAFAALIATEAVRWRTVIEKSNIRVN